MTALRATISYSFNLTALSKSMLVLTNALHFCIVLGAEGRRQSSLVLFIRELYSEKKSKSLSRPTAATTYRLPCHRRLELPLQFSSSFQIKLTLRLKVAIVFLKD